MSLLIVIGMIVGALAFSAAIVYFLGPKTFISTMPDYEVCLSETGEGNDDLPKSRVFVA